MGTEPYDAPGYHRHVLRWISTAEVFMPGYMTRQDRNASIVVAGVRKSAYFVTDVSDMH